MKNNKILIVAPNFPFPIDYGGAVDIWNRIELLSKLGYEIDLITTVKGEPKKEYIQHVEKYVEHLYLSKRTNKIKDFLFSFWPLQVSSRIDLKNIKLKNEYDLILLESEYVAYILKNPSLKGKKILLRVHNNEKNYFKSLAQSSGLKLSAVYYWSEYFKFTNLLPLILKKIDYFLFISNDEFQDFKNRNPEKRNNAIFLPAPIHNLNFKKRTITNKAVLFIGSLFMPNNIEAIEWYLEKVHPELLDLPGYKLIIVGSTRGYDITSFVKNLKKFSSLEIHQDVPDLEPFYERASIFINPMQNGTGVKIKSLNALVEGLPLVSTRIGSEGIGLVNKEHFFLANTPKEFSAAVKELLNNPIKGLKTVDLAQEYLNTINHKKILEYFLSEINAIKE